MIIQPTLGVILDYIRMVSYAIIILSSLYKVFERKFSSSLFVGDILMALGLLVCGICTYVLKMKPGMLTDLFLTPAAIIWATIHLNAMIKKGSS